MKIFESSLKDKRGKNLTKVGKNVLRYKPRDLYTECPKCGSGEIDRYVTGLSACKSCGNVWRVKNEKRRPALRFTTSGANGMELKILYDNEAMEGFRRGFGFSCFVEEKKILFDTGGDVGTLLFNMRKFMINPRDIDKIVLSHEHGDHTGGIQILDRCGEVEVFVPRSFSSRFKRELASHPNVNLKEVGGAGEICEGVFTTGELGHFIKEQSLIVKMGNGLTVITGCSHSGLENILTVASRFGDIYGVLGGFHGFSKLEALKGMRLIVPCHCTVRKREILNLYPESSVKCSAGCKIKI